MGSSKHGPLQQQHIPRTDVHGCPTHTTKHCWYLYVDSELHPAHNITRAPREGAATKAWRHTMFTTVTHACKMSWVLCMYQRSSR